MSTSHTHNVSLSQCLLQAVATPGVFSNATVVPAVKSIAKLTGYINADAFNATERIRVSLAHTKAAVGLLHIFPIL